MEDEYYTTSDLGLTATLSLIYPIEKIDKLNPKKVLFYFKNSPELKKMVSSYFNKKLKIEPQTYYMQVRTVKTMIYADTKRSEPGEDTA